MAITVPYSAELEAEEGREHEYLHNLHAHSSQPHHSQGSLVLFIWNYLCPN